MAAYLEVDDQDVYTEQNEKIFLYSSELSSGGWEAASQTLSVGNEV